MITQAQLVAIMPMSKARIRVFADPLNAAMSEFDINTPTRQAAFLAQIAHESGQLSRLSEDLNYSANALANTWPRRFAATGLDGGLMRYTASNEYVPNAQARDLHRDAERIANVVYAGRMGNGPVSSGDGWRYRGAGLIQMTGHENHHACAARFDLDPDTVSGWLRTPIGACRSAAWFWQSHGCNELSDSGEDEFTAITRKINGGLNGLSARCVYWTKAKEVLCGSQLL